MGQERVGLLGTVGMGGPSGDPPAAHLPLPRPATAGLKPAPVQGAPASPQAHQIAPLWLETRPASGCAPYLAPGPVAMATPLCPLPAAFGYLELHARGAGGVARRVAGVPFRPERREDSTPHQRRGGWGASAGIRNNHCVVKIGDTSGKTSPWGPLPDSQLLCSAGVT